MKFSSFTHFTPGLITGKTGIAPLMADLFKNDRIIKPVERAINKLDLTAALNYRYNRL
jgi:hypothetical protein